MPHSAGCHCLTLLALLLCRLSVRAVDDRIYVLKQINLSGMSIAEQNACVHEVQLLASIDSEYVVRYYDSFIDAGSLCIIMEYCANGDLHQLIKVRTTR